MKKYHVALSFAGEDREYVDKVAERLQAKGVRVFYYKFEETKFWGKDLYTYLSDVYEKRAFFTVMFISEAYKEKLWTNDERRSGQARAFSENKEFSSDGKKLLTVYETERAIFDRHMTAEIRMIDLKWDQAKLAAALCLSKQAATPLQGLRR